jgi:hypothetical protein
VIGSKLLEDERNGREATGTRGQLIGRGVIGGSLETPPIDDPTTIAVLRIFAALRPFISQQQIGDPSADREVASAFHVKRQFNGRDSSGAVAVTAPETAAPTIAEKVGNQTHGSFLQEADGRKLGRGANEPRALCACPDAHGACTYFCIYGCIANIMVFPTKEHIPMTDFVPTRAIHARKSFAQKTRRDSRAAACLVAAMFGKGPSFSEDADGNRIRAWQPRELQRFTNDDLRAAISNRVAVTESEMLGTVPPSAIKYCTTKGWLRAHGTSGIYFVTARAARELDLPARFRGGQHHGKRIRFAA